MKKLYLTLALLMCFASQIHAGEFAIQLTASKTPQLAPFTQLEEFGNLYTTDAGNGFIRTRLGTFSGKQAALEALTKIHAAGYKTAFLVNADSTDMNSGTSMTAENTSSTYLQDSTEWQGLTAEQQANVVNLDGTLHIKSGDNFIPLSEFVNK
jgi:hypothetical protein